MKRVLYIDDVPMEGFLLAKLMQKNGIEIHWHPYTTILDVMESTHLSMFDLVILDVNGVDIKGKLPYDFKVDGVEAVATSSAKDECGKFPNLKFVCKDYLKSWLINWGRE